MKRSRNIKKHLIPVCMVLAFALLLGLTLNLYEPFKRLTQKKAVNPKNLLLDEDIKWNAQVLKLGLTYDRNEDGSWHIYGTSTKSHGGSYLTLSGFSLESGKTYSFSSGLSNASIRGVWLQITSSDGQHYLGDIDPDAYFDGEASSDYHFGAFEARSGVTYNVEFVCTFEGAVVDVTVYPCLVEGTEPGDFYIYK